MTTKQRDAQILAAILKGAKKARFGIRPGRGWGISRSCISVTECGSVCAIGAGILYIGAEKFRAHDAEYFDFPQMSFFAEHFRVSHSYALGVSDGFEGSYTLSSAYMKQIKIEKDASYRRGYAVGRAVAKATAEA